MSKQDGKFHEICDFCILIDCFAHNMKSSSLCKFTILAPKYDLCHVNTILTGLSLC